MQITRTKKALAAVVALVLIGIFAALTAVCLPGDKSALPSMDNTVADTGSGEGALSTVSASAIAPSEDGTVPDGYQPSGTGITDIATARGDLDGEYYLTQNIEINTLAVATGDETNIFTGVFDGNGKKIIIDVTQEDYSDGNFGGLFAILQGTVKNCIIEVENFQIRLGSGSSWANAGMVAGAGAEGAYVENVKVVLKHSPKTVGNGSSDFYINQYGGQSAKGSSMKLGGVFGNIIGKTTVIDSTVDNQTTGSYGFSTYGWRASGGWTSHSDGFIYIGGFFGNIQSGSISASRLTLAGTSSSKIHSYNESEGSYRYNQALIGGVLGYADKGKMDINGLIITYPLSNNLGATNATYNCTYGIINGHTNSAGAGGSITNAYCLDGVQSAYGNSGGGQSLTAYFNTFASGITPVFVGTSEIAFNGFTKQAPTNASSIVATITQSGTTQNVMEALIATNESEAEQSVWLTVPYVNATSTAAIDLASSYATGSTIALSSDLTFGAGDGIYTASREYNGENVSASIVLGDGRTDLVYSEANANKHVGTHTLTSNIASASGYAYTDYAGTKYVYNTANKTIYTPQQVAGAAFDVTKALSVEITQRAITLGNSNGNITYGDTLETVQLNNIPSATSGSLVGGEYVESCTIKEYEQFAVNAGAQATFGYTGVVIKDASGADVTANYNISYGEGTAVVKQKTIAGALSVADLVYANAEKVAVFTAEEGMGLFNDDAVEITYSGDRQNVTETGFTATATVPKYDGSNSNYTFESGASISETFKITPYEVAITVNDEATTEYEYSGVVPNSVLLTLFNAPEGLAGETLFLNFEAFFNGETATVNYAGTYTVRATLAESYVGEDEEIVSQANYTAASCDATITIKAKEINVSLSDVENSKTYDGTVVGDDYLQTMFVVDGTVAEGHVAELDITVAEGEIKNAGVYNISVALPSHYDKMYAISDTSVTAAVYTVNGKPVDITAKSATAGKPFDGAAVDLSTLFTAPEGVNNEGALALTYVVSGAAETIFNVGTYTVTATLEVNAVNANYEATEAVVTYTVTPVTVEITWSENDYTYTGDVQTVKATYLDINDSPVEMAVSFGDGVEFKNAGEYTATASFAEGDNAFGNYVLPEVVSADYQIKKADSVINTDDVATVYTYTGELQTVTGATLNHSEAELVYSDNTFTTVAEGNDMVVTISVADTANYNGASTSFTITVNKATPVIEASVAEGQLFENGELPEITAFTDVDGTIAWDADQTLTAGANEYTWTFTPVDTANYNVVTGSETLNVAAVEMTGIEIKTQPNKVDYQYGDKFDKTGMVVEAVYNDDSIVTVEEYTFADEYLTTLGANQIEISYNGKTATVAVNVEAKEFEIAYSDLTVVAGTADFDLASITASIVGTENNTVSLAGVEYLYRVTIDYADAQYDQGAEVGIEYPLAVTLTVEDLDAQYYVGTYGATLKVIATSMEGNWASESVTAEYDGNAHAAVFNADNGLTAGIDFEIQYAIGGTEDWTTTAPVNAGEYVAKVVSKNDGYSADRLPTATVTINKASVSISASGVEESAYNGAAVAPATLFDVPQGVGDEGALALEYTITKDGAPVDEIKEAGTYKVVANLANEDGNYTAAACEATYTVSPAEVTVTWTGANSVVFSGEAYEPTFEATGLVGEDKISLTYEESEGTLTDDKVRNAGSYIATAVLPSANYTFASDAQQRFAFIIETAKITVTYLGSNVDVEYGTAYEWDIEDFYKTPTVNSDNFTVEFGFASSDALTDVATANKGTVYNATLSITVKYALSGEAIDTNDEANFEVVNGEEFAMELTVTIIVKQINVAATDKSATYDGEKASVDELLAMFALQGVDATLTVNGAVYGEADIKNVGTYTVAVASANANYEFVGDTDATFTVNAATITDVVVTGYKGEYDKAAYGAVVSATATTVDGIEVTFTYATSEDGVYGEAPEYTDAGVYTVWYKAVAANHNEVTGSFTVTISKAVVDLPEIESKPYNGEIQTATIAESTVYSVTKNEGGINAGDYEVTIVLADTVNYAWAGSDEDNDGSVTLTFTVTKVANAWTTEPAIDGWTYGAAANEPEGDALYGDVSFSYQTASGEPLGEKPVNSGSYILVATVDGNTNYEGLSMTVEFAVAKADYDMSSVVFENASKVYNGETQSITVDGELPDGVTVSYSEGIRNAGSIVITATFTSTDANYNAPEAMTATLTVTAKELTVTEVSAQNKTYDGTTAIEVNGSLAGVIGSDDVTLEISGTAVDKNVGTNKTVAVSASISGADSGNYTIADVDDVTVTITAKAVNVVWGELTLEYDGTAQAPTATADTGIDGETVSIAVSGAATEPGTYTATATTDNGNYTLTNASVEYEIVKTAVAAQFTVGYGVITVVIDGDNDVEYSVDGGDWATLPDDGKISVNLEASWTVNLRYAGDVNYTSNVVYTTADNVVVYLDNNLSGDALANKTVIDTANAWLETATGDKTAAVGKLEKAQEDYEAAKNALTESVQDAFKVTAKLTTRALAAAVAITTAVTGLGIAVGAIALRRKGGKKNED